VETAVMGNRRIMLRRWRETVETTDTVLARFEGAYREGSPAVVGNDRARYLAGLPDAEGLGLVMTEALDWAGVGHLSDLGDVRLARRGGVTFAFNFGPEAARLAAPEGARFLLGGPVLEPAGVAAWV